jgi:hypothetical protein
MPVAQACGAHPQRMIFQSATRARNVRLICNQASGKPLNITRAETAQVVPVLHSLLSALFDACKRLDSPCWYTKRLDARTLDNAGTGSKAARTPSPGSQPANGGCRGLSMATPDWPAKVTGRARRGRQLARSSCMAHQSVACASQRAD